MLLTCRKSLGTFIGPRLIRWEHSLSACPSPSSFFNRLSLQRGVFTGLPGWSTKRSGPDKSEDANPNPIGHRKKLDETWLNPVPAPFYTEDDINSVNVTHRPPEGIKDKIALWLVKAFRYSFDTVTNYRGAHNGMTQDDWLRRCIFLETVAGVPGMVAGMCRHLRSLRRMQRDYGWIHTLLREAENERMHLLIFMRMREATPLFRFLVISGQTAFFSAFFLAYLICPSCSHRFVGYLEEEAVKTYTAILKDVDVNGPLASWGAQPCPEIAVNYYRMRENTQDQSLTIRHMIAYIRADESHHCTVNHTLASLPHHARNPFMDS